MFAMFNVFVRAYNYLFVRLYYLFPESDINYLVLKYILKKYHANIGKCGLILKVLS